VSAGRTKSQQSTALQPLQLQTPRLHSLASVTQASSSLSAPRRMSSQRRMTAIAAKRDRARSAAARTRASSPEPTFSAAISKPPASPTGSIASPPRSPQRVREAAAAPMFPARSWREEIRETPKGLGSNMSASDLAQYSASKVSAGPDSPQRFARRYTSTERTIENLETTRSKIAAVRDMIRRFPQEPHNDTPHSVWIRNYAEAPRYEHADHGPWVGSPKGSCKALYTLSESTSRWACKAVCAASEESSPQRGSRSQVQYQGGAFFD
jgi:hypothetical protein